MMFYLNGITAIIMEWIRDGCGKSIDEVTRIIYHCIFGAWDRSAIESLLEQGEL